MQTLTQPQLFSDIWPLTLSDGDADHNLEAGSDSVEGRRIVNISYMASQMSCMACESVLALVNIKRELRIGFASQFKILCEVCSHVNTVWTDKRHESTATSIYYSSRTQPFDINTKAAIGKFLILNVTYPYVSDR